MNIDPKEFVNVYLKVLKTQYAVYEGRVQRKDYWMFFAVNFLVALVLNILISGIFSVLHLNLSIIGTLYALATLVPNVCIAIRRIHDIGQPGWLVIIPFYNLYLLAQPGEAGANAYGPAPTAI